MLGPGVLKDGEVRRDQVGEAGVVETDEDSCEDGIEGHAHERADQRRSEWIFGLDGQVT